MLPKDVYFITEKFRGQRGRNVDQVFIKITSGRNQIQKTGFKKVCDIFKGIKACS